ncbi:hypothetical protein CHF27_011005 [Romboutsia maritimum]|uniref:DUF4352 domain-containing protein n=1 Tax=Romboutsia maritimum TaxID=2020948 RepID=A0A371IQU0_9FIRM|nr:hypothetical protein [Romboutsia maritimum]RDY22842.1 hypothetical protein CHF27_011005 [Romboutsia maritimum]
MKISKNIASLLMIGTLSVSLVACSSSQENSKANGNDTTKQEQTKKEDKKESKGKTYTVDGAVAEEGGIVQTIKEVRVFDNMKDAVKSYNQNEIVVNDENKDKVTVVVKFEIKNNNDFKICTYPTQGTIITNTGEQKEADLIASESFDGDIHEKVTREGHVLFNLDKTKVDDLTSFKIAWNTSHDNGTADNYDDDYHKDNKLEVTLK